jgi:hypothetical protein
MPNLPPAVRLRLGIHTSGGGRDFMRAVCEEIYNIPRSMVIGSSVTFKYAEDAQGVAQVVRTKEIEQPIDDGPGKPPHIHRAIGHRPIMTAEIPMATFIC